jgi:hypothetical protein
MAIIGISDWVNPIGGVMVIMLTSSAVDRGLEPRSGREIWKLTPFHLSKCIFLIIQGIIFSKIGMLPHLDTLFLFQATQSLLFLLNAACLAEKQQIPI